MFSPERTCVACRTKKAQSELLKVVLKKGENEARVADGHDEGRGAYICRNLECIILAEKKKAFNRSFRKPVDVSIYEKLKEVIDD